MKRYDYEGLVEDLDGELVKWEDVDKLEAQSKKLWVALHHLVQLHDCEQEGIPSGMPTIKQWEDGVQKAREALKGA